ncbi:MAG: hypothetical protein G8345_13850 [Magnetococcales bacterium]|nr:hypothetical protein [Magnetococcales bacterium]NGZ27959.1 hypothetical protein [Magnetococcales bacterium]
MATEMNGWLVFEWGQALRAAITTSPWETELMVVLFSPAANDKEDLYHSALIPAEPPVTVERLQQLFNLTQRRAEYLQRAIQEAVTTFYTEEVEPPPHDHKVIPIFSMR